MTSFSGFEEFAEEMEDAADSLEEKAGGEVEDAIGRGVETTTRSAYSDARRHVPVDEGDLRDSIEIRGLVGRPLARQIVVTEDYAKAVEYGRGLVTITPDEKDALRFEMDGEIVFAAKVEQDPREDQPYIRPSLNQNRSTLTTEIREELRDTFRGVFD